MLLCSVSQKNLIKYCSEKRKYAVNLSSLLAVYFASSQIVEMRWKFSLVCALALYMLNQSKLYLGRHICLSICLWFYRSNHLWGKYKFQWRCKAETTARLFFLLAATIHQWNTERHSSDKRSIIGKVLFKALWMRPSARDETNWNEKSGDSSKILILFLFCFLDEIHKTILHWNKVYCAYILQH